MWINKQSPRTDFIRFNNQEARPLQKKFQRKYTAVISLFVLFSIAVAVIPMVYFFNQNYEIFIKSAYAHSPNLVQYLEQEKQWLSSYLLTAAITVTVFSVVFSLRVTARIVGPLLVLQGHIKALTRGNWSIDEVTVRDHDEFRELISSYNYFYHCMRQINREDISKLQSLSIDSSHRSSHKVLKKMIEEKSDQIGVASILSSVTSSASDQQKSHDSLHAS